MKNLMSSAIAFCKKIQVKHFVAVFLAIGVLFLANTKPVLANTNFANKAESSRYLERIQQADENTERPKTTGEFLEEARGDVPLNERVENITRDSAEAIKQFGNLYTTGASEAARTLKDKAEEAGENLTK